MRPHLIIRDFGPIKKVNIDLNKINVFIGRQSSGKSTIAKIISYCGWVEKDIILNLSKIKYEENKELFISKLMSFHNMYGYAKETTIIKYETDSISILFSKGETLIDIKDIYSYCREKISYIPSERNFSLANKIRTYEFEENNLKSFTFDWLKINERYNKENEFLTPKLGVEYHFDNEKGSQVKDLNGQFDIALTSASSGLQSIVPLVITFDYITNWIYTNKEDISFEEEERRRKIGSHLNIEFVLKPYFGKKEITPDEYKELHNNIIKALEVREEKAENCLNEWARKREKLVNNQHSKLIIEEPEQNLFPATQRDLVYYMLSKIQSNSQHSLTLTTHSPYILYALNNCMIGGLIGNKMTKNDANSIACKNSFINPSNVSVYEIDSGVIQNIQQEDGLIGNNFFDTQMKDLMDDYYIMLNYYGEDE